MQLVCGGAVLAGQAQREIATDWIAAYGKYCPGAVECPAYRATMARRGNRPSSRLLALLRAAGRMLRAACSIPPIQPLDLSRNGGFHHNHGMAVNHLRMKLIGGELMGHLL